MLYKLSDETSIDITSNNRITGITFFDTTVTPHLRENVVLLNTSEVLPLIESLTTSMESL